MKKKGSQTHLQVVDQSSSAAAEVGLMCFVTEIVVYCVCVLIFALKLKYRR